MAPMIETPLYQGWWLRPLSALGRRLLLVPEGVLLPAIFCLHLGLGRPPLLAFAGLAVSSVFLIRTALLILAGQALDQGAYRRAERLACWALRLYPLSADGLALFAQARRNSGDLVAAQAALRRAVALFPGHGALHAELSAALAAAGEHVGARAHALYALLLSPRQAWGYARMAELTLQVDGAAQEAAHLARRGLRVARQPAEIALLQLLEAEAQSKIGHDLAARTALEAAVQQLGDCPAALQAELLYRVALLRRVLGEIEEAGAALQRIEEVDPEGRYVGLAWRALHELRC